MRKHFSILALFVLLACILPMAASAATLKLPAALKTIETETFYGDTSLDAVQLPEGITSIESRAFANSSVNEINLPASLIYIADNAFSGSSLAAVHAERGTYAYEWAVQHGYLKPVTGIAISHSTNNHYIGSVGNYTDYITISPANATNKTLYWSSSNPAAVTIDRETGDMNCVAAGTSDITATTADGGFTATCRVTVVPPPTGISLDKTEITVPLGGSQPLTAAVLPEGTIYKSITWKSSNENVAAVNSAGVVSGAAIGSATITATVTTSRDIEYSATCEVTVIVPVTGVTLSQTSATIKKGDTLALTATVAPSDATNKAVTWSSSDTSVATVDSAGKVTAIAGGTAAITAKTTDGGKIAVCTITVDSITVTGGTKNTGIVCRNIYITASKSWTATTTDSWLTMYNTTDSTKKAKTISGDAGNSVPAYVWLEQLPLDVESRTGKITFTCGVATYVLSIVQSRTDAPMTRVSFPAPATGTWVVGETKRLIPTFEPSYATDRRVTWSSDNTAVATVDADGNVKGIAPGTAKITVKTTDGGFTAVYTVNIDLKVSGGTKANGIVCRTIYLTATSSWTATTEDSWIKISTVLDSNTASNKMSGNAATDLKCYAWLTELPLTVASRTGHIVFKCGDTSYTLNIVQDRTDAPMVGVSLSPNSAIIPQYGSVSPTVSFNPSYATDKRITWSSSDTSVATVDANGKITGKAAGTADITVTTTDGSKTATCKVTVVKLNISPTYGIMAVGTSKNLQSSVLPTSLSDFTTTWTSSDDTVLHVDTTTDTNQKPYIKVTGKKAGTAVITGKTKLGGATCTYTMTVVSTTLNKTSLSLVVDGSETLKATVNPSQYNGAANGVTWSSSNDKVAAVDQNGKVTAKTAGTATITATSTYGGAKATCDVTVVNKVSVASISVPKNSYTVSEVVPYTIKISGGKEPYTVKVVEYFNGSYKWDKTVTPDEEMKYIYNADFYNSDFKKGGTNYIVVTVTDSLGNTATKQSGNVTVKPSTILVTGISIKLSNGTTVTNKKCQMNVLSRNTLIASVEPSNAENTSIRWSSSDSSVISIDETTGAIQALKAGKVTITATAKDGGGAKATCEIEAKAMTVSVTPERTSYNVGETRLYEISIANCTKPLTVKCYEYYNGSQKATYTFENNSNTEYSYYGDLDYGAGTYYMKVEVTDARGQKVNTQSANVTVVEPISFSPAFSNLNGSNYAITYLVNEYSHYAYSVNTFTGTQVEVMPSTELKLYAVGTNSKGETYAKILYNGQTLYIPMWKVTGNWTGGAWTAQSAVSATYMYPGGGKAGSIDAGDTVYTLQESNGWRQVMYNISGGNWKIAWYQFSGSGSGSQTGKELFVSVAETEATNSRTKSYYGFSGAWCAAFVSWCADQANIPTNQIVRTSTAGPGLFSDYGRYGKIFYFKYTDNMKNWGDSYLLNVGFQVDRSSFVPQRGDLIFFNWNDSSYDFDHVGIVTGVDGNEVYYVDGNGGNGNVVAKRHRSKTDTQIVAYYRPF